MSNRGLVALAAVGLAAAVGVGFIVGCGDSPSMNRAVIGFQAPPLADVKWVPAFELGTEPSVFNEGALLGKVVVIDFFASWCRDCKAVAPELAKLHDRFAGQDVLILGVTEDTVPTAMRFAGDMGWDDKIPIAVDENARVRRFYGVNLYPTTVIVDRTGIVRWRGEGATADAIAAEIAKWAAQPRPAGAGGARGGAPNGG